jgi:hypothetical protein
MWDLGDQPPAASRATMGARHVGFGPGSVDEDQPVGKLVIGIHTGKPLLLLIVPKFPP